MAKGSNAAAVGNGAEGVKFADLSGLEVEAGQNPYGAFITACGDDPARIQRAYLDHRTKRNASQKEKFLSPDFQELFIDPFLFKLEHPETFPGYQDTRHCLVFWARPPDQVLRLAAEIQKRLKAVAPHLWLIPTHRMHMTTLEVAFAKTSEEIGDYIAQIRSHLLSLVSMACAHRVRLVKPMISYDVSAFALSFVPAAGEKSSYASLAAGGKAAEAGEGESYTYHHLRRDVFDAVTGAGVDIGSRYQVPSAHITLGRYLVQDDHKTPEARQKWTQAIEDINKWLEDEVWDVSEGNFIGEWVVGQERGLDARCGTLWYGGGRTLLLGEGF